MQNLYEMCFDLINNYVFDGGLENGTIEYMFTIFFSLLATFGCLLLPFALLWKFICRVFGI